MKSLGKHQLNIGINLRDLVDLVQALRRMGRERPEERKQWEAYIKIVTNQVVDAPVNLEEESLNAACL